MTVNPTQPQIDLIKGFFNSIYGQGLESDMKYHILHDFRTFTPLKDVHRRKKLTKDFFQPF